MNGTTSLTNGEVEDFYVNYYFPLPATLTSFDAIKQNSKTLLQWSTAGEQNNKGFEIERSTDSRNWGSIGFVSSKATGGSSSTQLSYSFVDNTPASGRNFYRLKQTDFDGKYEYSHIRQVSFNNRKINIYPNPAKTFITVTGLSGNETINLCDITGKTLNTIPVADRTTTITLENLVAGMYMLKILIPNEKTITEKVVIVK